MDNFPFEIVGFDLDGTLLDTSQDIGMALNHALRLARRAEIPLELVSGLIGGGARTMVDRALVVTGGAEGVDPAAMHRDLLTYYAANIAVHTQFYPGGAEMLDALDARGVKLALVTNKLEALARQLPDELGLTQRFALILGGDSLGPGRAKPAPDLLNEMVARLGGGRAAYVGDTTFDTRAARAAGLPCVGVSFGFADVPLANLGASAMIDHYDQLVPTLIALGN